MIEIGGKQILWHIMKMYSSYGFNEFVILLGYKGYFIKEYFTNYFLHQSDVTIDIKNGKMEILNNTSEPWKVTLLDTGLNSMTGGRIKRLEDYLDKDTFMMTYGDRLCNVNINNLVTHHKKKNKLVTLCAVRPPARFGNLELTNDGLVKSFLEKSQLKTGRINGGFFVMEPEFLEYLDNDSTVLERDPLEKAAAKQEVSFFKHDGFWQCMDTKRDRDYLEELTERDTLPWLV